MTLQIGDTAPRFHLADQAGQWHSLTEYSGQWVLLYFYPKDDTPGCTTEACSLRDHRQSFAKYNAVVLGVSTDSVQSHAQFVQKYQLPFTLLADPDKTVVQAYGVQGRLGTKRTSFLIDLTGKIAKIYENVKPAEHTTQVLADLRNGV